jgi:hypothetical protein
MNYSKLKEFGIMDKRTEARHVTAMENSIKLNPQSLYCRTHITLSMTPFNISLFNPKK